jgi:MFS family permease
MQTSSVTANDSVINTQAKEKPLTTYALTLCILGVAFYCYEYYLRVAPSVMAEELKNTFSLNETSLGFLAAFYYYAYAPMQIPVGLMLDRFGLKIALTFACLLCAGGTYLFAATSSIYIAQMGRFLIGFGSAFAYVGVLKISNIWLPKKYFAFMAGVTTALGMIGAMTGELTMAYWVNKVGWQSTLNGTVIIGLVLTSFLWIFIREQKSPPQYSSINSSGTSIIQGLFLITKNPQLWLTGLIGCLLFLPISVFSELWAVPFLQSVGFSKSQAAMGSSLGFLGFAAGGPCWGLISEVIHSRRIPLIIGSFLSAICMLGAIQFPSTSTVWMFSLIFMASFCASVEILVFAISNDLSDDSVSATAAAFTNMLVMLGGLLLLPVVGHLLDNSVKIVDGLLMYSNTDFSLALIILPVGLLVSGLLSFFLKESHKR